MSGRAVRRGLALAAVAAGTVGLGGCGGGGATTGTRPADTVFDGAFPTRTATVPAAAPAPRTEREPAPATTTASAAAPRPPIVAKPIPYGPQRQREMADYSARHYGERTAALTDPKVIVEHYTETPDVPSTYATFAGDAPDPELHELPNVCAHFVVDTDGTIYQLVPLRLRCRHTVGLNWTAIGIEQVGSSDAEILGRPAQLDAVLKLTEWLQCRYGIATRNVIGHNESLTSPYHREAVAALRTQTHDDWQRADMDRVRARLRGGPCG